MNKIFSILLTLAVLFGIHTNVLADGGTLSITYSVTSNSSCNSTPSCLCNGYMRSLKVVYVGQSGATISAYKSSTFTSVNLLATFNNVQNGQVLTVNGPNGGQLNFYTYLTISGQPFAKINTSCSSSIIGKAYGPYRVVGYTDGQNNQCNIGLCGGSIDILTVSRGCQPYTYIWSTGATTQDLTNLCPGTYTVTITDCEGGDDDAYSVVKSFTIGNVTSNLALSIAASDDCQLGPCDGSVNLSVSGGTAPYTYLWSNGATTQDLSGLCSGTYSVTVTAAGGCTKTISTQLTPSLPLLLSLETKDNFCVCASCDTGHDDDDDGNGDDDDGEPKNDDDDGNGDDDDGQSDNDDGGFDDDDDGSGDDDDGHAANDNDDGDGDDDDGSADNDDGNSYRGSGADDDDDGSSDNDDGQTDNDNDDGSGDDDDGQTDNDDDSGDDDDDGNGDDDDGNPGNDNDDGSGDDDDGHADDDDDSTGDEDDDGQGDDDDGQSENDDDDGGPEEDCAGSVEMSVSGGKAPLNFLWSNGATTKDLNGLEPGTYLVTVTDANGCSTTGMASIGEGEPFEISTEAKDNFCECAAFEPPHDDDDDGNGDDDDGECKNDDDDGDGDDDDGQSDNDDGGFDEDDDGNGDDDDSQSGNDNDDGDGDDDDGSADNDDGYTNRGGGADDDDDGNGDDDDGHSSNDNDDGHGDDDDGQSDNDDDSGHDDDDGNGDDDDGNSGNDNDDGQGDDDDGHSDNDDDGGNGNCAGSVEISMSCGQEPFTFIWSNGATSQKLDSLDAGVYSVTVTDANGCSNTATDTVGTPPPVLITGTTKDFECSCLPDVPDDDDGHDDDDDGNGDDDDGECKNDDDDGDGDDDDGQSDNDDGGFDEDDDGNGDDDDGSAENDNDDGNGDDDDGSADNDDDARAATPDDDDDGNSDDDDGECNNDNDDGGGDDDDGQSDNDDDSGDDDDDGNGDDDDGDAGNDNDDGDGDDDDGQADDDDNGSGDEDDDGQGDDDDGNADNDDDDDGSGDDDCEGCITVEVSGGVPPYSFKWSNGSDNQNQCGLEPGSYTVTVTSANGCGDTATFEVDDIPGLELEIEVTQPTCEDPCGGSATVNVLTGTPPFTFLWSTGETTATVNGLCPGAYYVTVEDANLCRAIDTVVVTTPEECDDNNECTIDDCVNGQCTNTPRDCNDNDECTIDNCNPATGCVYTPVVCNDQNNCTTDACVNGGCVYTPIVCNDQNSCTTDACVNGGCVYTPVVCNDQNNCTTDACVNGGCVYTPITCNDQNPCTSDACVNGACVYTSTGLTADATGTNPSACDVCDGAASANANGGIPPYTYMWSTGDATQSIGGGGGGGPQPGTTKKYINSGGGQFITGTMDTFLADVNFVGGATFSTAAAIAGTTDDGLYQNERNTGNSNVGTTLTYSIPVTNGQYDVSLYFAELFFGVSNFPPGTSFPYSGLRKFDVSIEGVLVLDDYDINGDVGPATAVIKTFSANVADGNVTLVFTNVGFNRAKINAISVNPAQSQGGGDGLCAGTYYVTVTDAAGCAAVDSVTLSSTTCDDGNPCTIDFCVDNECVYTPIVCNDNNACTTDGPCVNGVCQYTPIVCNDNNACTTNGPCVNGVCQYTPIVCNDNNACTTDGPCVNGVCQYTPIVCNDNNACTTNGPCVNGVCQYTPIVCNDNNACTTDGPCVNGVCQYTPVTVSGTITKNDVSCDCQEDTVGLNPRCVLSYDNLLHGEFVNTQFASYGITVHGDANGNIDTVIVFNSNFSGTPDPDLEADLGNLLILPNNITDNNNDGIVDVPNDWAGGGSQTFTFAQPHHIESFIFVDNDQAVPGSATAYDGFNQVITSVPIPVTANGGFVVVNVNASGVRRFVIAYNGSGGAVGRMIICDPDTCCDGSARAMGSGGAAPYGYAWSNGATTASIGELCPGEYCVTITDANGCSTVKCITIGEEVCEDPCENVICNDEDPCTVDVCDNGACLYTQIPGCGRIPCISNTQCFDNDGCTIDFCDVDGFCTNVPVTCNDQNSCTTDACVNGQCVYTPIVCNDQNPCTTNACVNGQCVYTPVVCNDQNPCTNDACVNGQCQFTPIVCNDNNECTTDACVNGQCVYTPIQGCGGCPNAITSLTLVRPGFGGDIGPLTNGAVISYETLCTGFSIRANACLTVVKSARFVLNASIFRTESAAPFSINGDNAGSYIAWTPAPGFYTLTVIPYTGTGASGTAGTPITVTFTVVGTTSCNDQDVCTTDACDRVTGLCAHIAIPGCGNPCTGVTCNDNNACTTDACANGQCVYTPIVCTDQNSCTTDACVNGQCVYTPIVCNDQNSCTTDACVGGQCQYTPVVCNDQNSCTTDACVNGQCQYTPIVCNDANLCTTDACVGGQCQYTAVTCNDGNACTTNNCSPTSGCFYTPIVCNDNNQCTSDACVAGECTFTQIVGCGGDPCSAFYCDDQNPCTVDVGNGVGGCTNTPVVNTPDYLRIVNTTTNSLNLKVLYGSTSSWVNQNVSAGGNNMLCITLRDATNPGTLSKVHIRLKGSSQTEATRVTNNYPVGCVPRGWTTICIPLSNFPNTDFTALPYVEIFNSAAAPYELHILKIEFTGGATPFLWFGAGHSNNYVSGNTASFSAQLVTGGPCNGAPKLSANELSNVVESLESEISSLEVYPNPFNNRLMVEFVSKHEGKAEVSIVDVLGQIVKTEAMDMFEGENERLIDVDGSLADGMYFLELRTGEEVKYVKLYKSR